MKATPLALPGVVLVSPDIHRDERGFFSETYSRTAFAAAGIDQAFVQDNHSMSINAGIIRGLHFQSPPKAQGKLVRVTAGAIQDVVVDLRIGSPTYGQHLSVELSAANWRQLWVPVGFAHGFCTLEPNTEVLYKVTDDYAPEHSYGVAWDDPNLAIDWQVDRNRAIVNERDRSYPPLARLAAYFHFSG